MLVRCRVERAASYLAGGVLVALAGEGELRPRFPPWFHLPAAAAAAAGALAARLWRNGGVHVAERGGKGDWRKLRRGRT